MTDSTVCIVGLGYVGLTLAVAMADAGITVYGTEIRADMLAELREGYSRIHEPGLIGALRRLTKSGRLRFYNKVPDERSITVYIITVGTPLGDDGLARHDMIERASREVSERACQSDMVILRSTVKIGTTRKLVKDWFAGQDVAFCPERTLEGAALSELRWLPQIVGGVTHEASMRAAQLFQCITPTVIRVKNPDTAEMIKLVSNAHRDVSFAYSNEIARVCDGLEGISAAGVIRAGNIGYPRTNLPMPGLVGGPCLSKDSHILVESSPAVDPTITRAARDWNERQPYESVSFIRAMCHKRNIDVQRIALLGFAFKGRPATDDMRGTPATAVISAVRVLFRDASIVGYDPVVRKKDVAAMGLRAETELVDAFADADVVIVMNNHPVFEEMPLEELARCMSTPGIIYDFWNLHSARPLALPGGIRYVALGSHGVET